MNTPRGDSPRSTRKSDEHPRARPLCPPKRRVIHSRRPGSDELVPPAQPPGLARDNAGRRLRRPSPSGCCGCPFSPGRRLWITLVKEGDGRVANRPSSFTAAALTYTRQPRSLTQANARGAEKSSGRLAGNINEAWGPAAQRLRPTDRTGRRVFRSTVLPLDFTVRHSDTSGAEAAQPCKGQNVRRIRSHSGVAFCRIRADAHSGSAFGSHSGRIRRIRVAHSGRTNATCSWSMS